MKIVKQSQGGQSVDVTQEDLEQINRLSRRPLTAQEVYTFAVRLCDNEVDRDLERFPEQTLGQLASMFVGKCGIFDHQWSAKGQNARIYRTEVVREDRLTQAGDGYCYLKGWAYMVRTRDNEGLIAEIEGGIKKEVSVGCAVKRSVCSVCGEDFDACGHEKGKEYGGKLCFVSLEQASDAYEFSFVAVPAQRQAGVIKGAKPQYHRLAQVVKDHPGCAAELERLEKQARAGRAYLEQLRKEMVRLGGMADEHMDLDVLRAIADKLEEEELLAMQRTFQRKTEEKYALNSQLDYSKQQYAPVEQDGAFLI